MMYWINLLRIAAFAQGHAYGKIEAAALLKEVNVVLRDCIAKIDQLEAELEDCQARLERAAGRDAGVCRNDIHAARWGVL